jgi:hypothetical protein
LEARKEIEIWMKHGRRRRLRVGGSAPGGFVGGFAWPGGKEGMEIVAFFGGEAAFFIRCCSEPVLEDPSVKGVGGAGIFLLYGEGNTGT